MIKHFSTVMLMLLVLFSFSACGEIKADTPESAVKGFCTEFKEADFKTAFKYVDTYDGFGYDNRDKSGTKDILTGVAKTLEFTDGKKTNAENPVCITTTVKTADLREVYKQAVENVVSNSISEVLESNVNGSDLKKKITEEIVAILESDKAPKVETELTFKLEETDGNWYILMDDLTSNVLCGYISDANTWFDTILSESYEQVSSENQ